MRRSVSFQLRILLIVLVLGIIPLGLLGLWLTESTTRSGEALVRAQLDESVGSAVSRVVSRWYRLRSALLYLAEDSTSQRALDEGETANPPATFVRIFEGLESGVRSAVVRDVSGRELWRVDRTAGLLPDPLQEMGAMGLLTVPLEVRDRLSATLLGTVDVSIVVSSILPFGGLTSGLSGTILGVFEVATGVSLVPLPLDPSLLAAPEFTWEGNRWVTAERALGEPPIRLVAAAPLTPFLEPFQSAARNGAGLVLVVALVGLALAVFLTTRLTRSLKELSAAADGVSKGDLTQRVEVRSGDEVGRVAEAFNTMTESLQRTLRQLSTRESLAAVGEFAASLAHEIRNPLTAIKVDLQLAEEEMPKGSPGAEAQARALREIARLDESVGKALRVARTGSLETGLLDLRVPIRAAADAARPLFMEREATLRVHLGEDPLPVSGDAGALEDLFLNLLRNAAQALEAGGTAEVRGQVEEERVTVVVQDDGIGIPEDLKERVFEPLFSTRPEGTGLGLTAARRVASAHGGDLVLESTAGEGTSVRVTFPSRAQGL
ncbi:MAG: ATP-binding protein [Longimicrobiales bacterium]|nr:ATP-binding protein [Longimicrobiales bacterium]